jgi:rubredoxin-NAD+ reductase
VTDPIVIVGSGLAGYTVAREVRKLDAQRALVLVTGDNGDFYSKPMLSNALAQNKNAGQLVNTPAATIAAQVGLSLRNGTKVLRIDRAAHRIETTDGTIGYSQLVLAIGADPIRLPLAGDAANRVRSVNDLRDYATFRSELDAARRVAIIGAGLIGCEFANDLAGAGFSVVVIDPMAQPLANLLPGAAGDAVRAALADAGIEWRLGTAVQAVDATAAGVRLTLNDGSTLDADVVLSAVGLRPRTQLAREAGLATERGIVVDAYGRTSDPDIVAIGDCAQYGNAVLPYVLPIMNAARGLARTLISDPTPIAFPTMPVIVKTPACPVAVVPAPKDVPGDWATEGAGSDLKLVFSDGAQRVRGFALTGARTAERAAWVKRVAT